MTRDDALAKIAHLRRRAYRPVLEDGDGTATDSKLGGTPYLPPGTASPSCGHCSAPMPLLAQLNIAQFPEPLRKEYGSGLLQIFECRSADRHGGQLLRLIAIGGDSESEPGALAGKIIRSWRVTDDYPCRLEREALGALLDDDETEALEGGVGVTWRGDKLSGWPAWEQSIEYPSCQRCEKPMRLVMQLDTGRGVAHLTQCRTHKDELAFG